MAKGPKNFKGAYPCYIKKQEWLDQANEILQPKSEEERITRDNCVRVLHELLQLKDPSPKTRRLILRLHGASMNDVIKSA